MFYSQFDTSYAEAVTKVTVVQVMSAKDNQMAELKQTV